MPVRLREPGLLLPRAELHPEGPLGYHPADPIHPLSNMGSKQPVVLEDWKTPSALPHLPWMHTSFHSLSGWKTLGTTNRRSRSLANTLPPPRPPFAPHSSHSPPSIIPRIWGVSKRAERRDRFAARRGLEQLFFYLPGWEDSSPYPASSCLSVSSAQLSSRCPLLGILVGKALSTTRFS